MDIAFEDFRGFRKQNYVSVKPLTVIVGENSAGKSSFLAGLKFFLDFTNRYSEPSFNADPFQLGTFQQIAHFRGGRGGRAREFKLKIKSEVDPAIFGSAEAGSKALPFELILTFSSADSQASLSAIRLSSQGSSLHFNLSQDGVQIEYQGRRGQKPVPLKSSASRYAGFDIQRMWFFIFQDLGFRYDHNRLKEVELEIEPKVAVSVSKLAGIGAAIPEVFTSNIEATSAIRTKPSRTYTPGTETQDGEGTHVPFEIAKLYRSRTRNREAWSNFKTSIEAFGAMSGMFKEISVKSFGQTTSDPFQIQFASDGPKTNIVDLGYGTSQVLPIIYDVTQSQPDSQFLIQQPEVHLHPKAQAALGEFFVDEYTRTGKRFVIETHSDFIVDRIRFAIAEKRLDISDVSLLFFRRNRLENKITTIELDSFGDPILPPDDYRAFFVGEQLKMLGV